MTRWTHTQRTIVRNLRKKANIGRKCTDVEELLRVQNDAVLSVVTARMSKKNERDDEEKEPPKSKSSFRFLDD